MKGFATATALLFLWICNIGLGASGVVINTPMTPPYWALLERELLKSQTVACERFFEKYFDQRGYLQCVERWGGLDGPDDAIENLRDWPTLHALGAPDVIHEMYRKAWEGHLLQYTEAKTTDVEFARDGMYYKEFPTKMDWMHNGEGLVVFNLQGLSDPTDPDFQRRQRRFAGFYMGKEPGSDNYDPKHKIIRSLFNGSRGPLLRKAIPADWAGDPIVLENRFKALHGESNYEEMLEHFKDYTDVVGDHPLNLLTTTLATNAYMLAHERKYRDWVLEYVDAWMERMEANDGIIPSNIGLDGSIGGSANGKWYGGAYGWGFTTPIPGTTTLAHRNRHEYGLVGFINAFLLTGDRRYLDIWRRQMDRVNSHFKVVNGERVYPTMYGDEGWYQYTPKKYDVGALELYYFLMEKEDLKRLSITGWLAFLEGKDPDYPERELRKDLDILRRQMATMEEDPTSPDTRLADDSMKFNPARVGTLIHLMLGALHHIAHETQFIGTPTQDMQDHIRHGKIHAKRTGHRGSLLHSRLRYFDPQKRRSGIPEDVAALVTKLSATETVVTLVNINQVNPKSVTVQGGAYGEHQCLEINVNGVVTPINHPFVRVELAPGAGAKVTLRMKLFSNLPTLAQPWTRESMLQAHKTNSGN